MGPKLPSYSIAIRTLGTSGEMFKKELDSIAKQTIPPEKIFIYLAEGYEKPKYSLGIEEYRIVPKGMVSQRALSYEEIPSDFIMFLDDDVELAENSMESLLQTAIEHNADCICTDTFHNHKANNIRRLYNILVNFTFPFKSNRWAFKISSNGALCYNSAPKNKYYETQTGEGPAWMVRKKVWDKVNMEAEKWMDTMGFAYADDQLEIYKLHSNGFKCGLLYKSGITHLNGATSSGKYKSNPQRFRNRSKAIFINWHRMKMCNPNTSLLKKNLFRLSFLIRFIAIFPSYIGAAITNRNFKIIGYHFSGLLDGIKYIKKECYRSLPPYVLPQ